MQGVAAAVLGIFPPLRQTALLEFVDQRHQPACHHPQSIGESLLGNRRRPSQNAQNSCVGRCQVQPRQPLAKFLGGMGADLREQERR